MNKKFRIFLSLFIFSVLLGISFRLLEGFAEFYTLKIAPVFRIPLSFISSVFPFSIGESTILLLGVIGIAATASGLFLCIIKITGIKAESHFGTYSKILLCILSFIYFTYVFAFSSSYARAPVSETLGLKKVEMTAENISKSLNKVTDGLSTVAEELDFTYGRATASGMTFDEISENVLECAKSAANKYSFFQKHPFKAKPIVFSTPLAYTGISGVYSFYTGESNVNTRFPEYTLPFTIAHEYSHQMGIGSEKEAEFSALLICLESDNPYIRYSAYSQVAITLLNLLFELDEDRFYDCFSALPNCLVNDIYLSSLNSQKYSETYADEIAEAINNAYLSVSGDEGVISYDLSSQLYVAYFLRS